MKARFIIRGHFLFIFFVIHVCVLSAFVISFKFFFIQFRRSAGYALLLGVHWVATSISRTYGTPWRGTTELLVDKIILLYTRQSVHCAQYKLHNVGHLWLTHESSTQKMCHIMHFKSLGTSVGVPLQRENTDRVGEHRPLFFKLLKKKHEFNICVN